MQKLKVAKASTIMINPMMIALSNIEPLPPSCCVDTDQLSGKDKATKTVMHTKLAQRITTSVKQKKNGTATKVRNAAIVVASTPDTTPGAHQSKNIWMNR